MEEWEVFRDTIKKVNNRKVYKVTGSLGVYDAYKYTRKNKWYDIGRPITEKEYYAIIRTVNNKLIDRLLQGLDIVLPLRMGTIEIRKSKTFVKFKDGKIVTNRPIDWDKTLRLWFEDKDSFDNKVLVRVESKEKFSIIYNKTNANYNNLTFYEFTPNRFLKQKLKHKINNNEIDAFMYGKVE